jgi:hypothetical protein
VAAVAPSSIPPHLWANSSVHVSSAAKHGYDTYASTVPSLTLFGGSPPIARPIAIPHTRESDAPINPHLMSGARARHIRAKHTMHVNIPKSSSTPARIVGGKAERFHTRKFIAHAPTDTPTTAMDTDVDVDQDVDHDIEVEPDAETSMPSLHGMHMHMTASNSTMSSLQSAAFSESEGSTTMSSPRNIQRSPENDRTQDDANNEE